MPCVPRGTAPMSGPKPAVHATHVRWPHSGRLDSRQGDEYCRRHRPTGQQSSRPVSFVSSLSPALPFSRSLQTAPRNQTATRTRESVRPRVCLSWLSWLDYVGLSHFSPSSGEDCPFELLTLDRLGRCTWRPSFTRCRVQIPRRVRSDNSGVAHRSELLEQRSLLRLK